MIVPQIILYALALFLVIFGSAGIWVSRVNPPSKEEDLHGLGELCLVFICWSLAAFATYLAGLL